MNYNFVNNHHEMQKFSMIVSGKTTQHDPSSGKKISEYEYGNKLQLTKLSKIAKKKKRIFHF